MAGSWPDDRPMGSGLEEQASGLLAARLGLRPGPALPALVAGATLTALVAALSTLVAGAALTALVAALVAGAILQVRSTEGWLSGEWGSMACREGWTRPEAGIPA